MFKYLYAIRDLKVGFMPCFCDTNDAVAVRNFQYAMQRPETLYMAHPSDFELYCVGKFNLDNGQIETFDLPIFLCRAADFAEVKNDA